MGHNHILTDKLERNAEDVVVVCLQVISLKFYARTEKTTNIVVITTVLPAKIGTK
jgi:hypothetical protein